MQMCDPLKHPMSELELVFFTDIHHFLFITTSFQDLTLDFYITANFDSFLDFDF